MVYNALYRRDSEGKLIIDKLRIIQISITREHNEPTLLHRQLVCLPLLRIDQITCRLPISTHKQQKIKRLPAESRAGRGLPRDRFTRGGLRARVRVRNRISRPLSLLMASCSPPAAALFYPRAALDMCAHLASFCSRSRVCPSSCRLGATSCNVDFEVSVVNYESHSGCRSLSCLGIRVEWLFREISDAVSWRRLVVYSPDNLWSDNLW